MEGDCMKAYVGTSGWQYKHWNARFFPADLSKNKWLNYYSSKLKSVEVNTTFYHMARHSTFDKWFGEVGRDFIFVLKMYRLFTHFKKLKLTAADNKILDTFIRGALRLKNKLGPILIQFPPNMQSDLKNLDKFFALIKSSGKQNKIRLATEFRHKSWFNEDTYALLKKYNVAWVITNSPEWPSEFIKTADFVYMRFHGRTKLFASNYTNAELKSFAKKLKALKPKKLYCYFNNDAEGYAASNALYMHKLLNA